MMEDLGLSVHDNRTKNCSTIMGHNRWICWLLAFVWFVGTMKVKDVQIVYYL